MTATPIWLGSDSRPLFGWLHLPEDGRAAGAVVLCPTMGLEAFYSYRTLRRLAERLADVGLAAVRFDYDGVGNSAGGRNDAGRTSAWLESVRTAVDYARGLGVGRVAVVGLRIGGTLAAAELAARGMVDDLVLWDPCASGKSFLREQRALWSFLRGQAMEWGTLREGDSWGLASADGKHEDGSTETPGLVFNAETVSDLETVAIANCESELASRVFLLLREGRKTDRRMSERLAMSHVESAEILGQEQLLAVDALTPQETIDKIVLWLSKPLGSTTLVSPPSSGAAVVGQGHDGRPIVERAVEMGPLRLFGVLTEPQGGTERSGPTVVFLNAGRINHHGPARLWVDLARLWSARGLRCLRFDLSGIGDSPTRPGRVAQVDYPADASIDVAEVRQSITAGNPTDVFFVGLCSGGYHAIESALQQRVDTICAVNPVLTFYRGTPPPEGRFEELQGEVEVDRQAWSSTKGWTRVLPVDTARKVMKRLPEGAWWFANRLMVQSFPGRTFKRLVNLDVNLLIVAGTNESRLLRRGEQRMLRSLTATGRFRMETIHHLEHSLLERQGREKVATSLTAYVAERFGLGPVATERGFDA